MYIVYDVYEAFDGAKIALFLHNGVMILDRNVRFCDILENIRCSHVFSSLFCL